MLEFVQFTPSLDGLLGVAGRMQYCLFALKIMSSHIASSASVEAQK